MTLAKRLLLGSAAALVATSGAQAADLGLPVAPAVDYVQICSIGSFTGFVLPGSDVCFDISGYARGQITWTEEIDTFSFGTGTAASVTELTTDVATGTTGTGLQTAIVPANISAAAAIVPGTAGAANALNEVAAELFRATTGTLAASSGYNLSLFDQFNTGWGAVSVNQDDDTFIGDIAAQTGAIQFTAAGAAASGFAANNDWIAGLSILNVAGDNDENQFDGEARLNFDARTMTEYGLLRGFIRLGGENGGAANVDRAFVQMNVGSLGFTAGLADSVFDPVFTGYGSGAAQGLGLADQASNQFSVNAAVGNGVTVSLSIEDDDARTGTILGLAEGSVPGEGSNGGGANGFAVPTTTQGGFWTLSSVGYDGGASMPDFIAAIRVDQAWGSAKLAAGLHEVNPVGSTVDSEWGYALSASAEFNIPVGVGSTFGITGIYAHGAQQFMGFNNEVGNSVTGFADAILVTTDTTTAAATTMLDLTTSYTIAAGFNFGVNSMVDLSIDGSYADVDHFGSMFDGNVWTVRGGIAYTPVNNLTINAHVSYAQSDFNLSNFRTNVDDDEWGARFRVTRSF